MTGSGPGLKDIPVELRTVPRCQVPASVMVWAGVTSSSLKTPLIFVDKGVKINKEFYVNMLEQELVPWVRDNVGMDGISFMQDGVPAHTANFT